MTTHPWTRSVFCVLIAAVTALSGIAPSAPAAHALSVDVTCAGTETVTYQPGLLLTPQQVQVVVLQLSKDALARGPTTALVGSKLGRDTGHV